MLADRTYHKNSPLMELCPREKNTEYLLWYSVFYFEIYIMKLMKGGITYEI